MQIGSRTFKLDEPMRGWIFLLFLVSISRSCTWRRTGNESRTNTSAISGPKNNVNYVLEVNIFRRVNIFSFIARSRALRTNLRLLPRWISVRRFFPIFHCTLLPPLRIDTCGTARYAETIHIYAVSVHFFSIEIFHIVAIGLEAITYHLHPNSTAHDWLKVMKMKMEVQKYYYYYAAIDMW